MVGHSHFSNTEDRFEYLQLVMLRSIFRYNDEVFMRTSVGESEGNNARQKLVIGLKKKQIPACPKDKNSVNSWTNSR